MLLLLSNPSKNVLRARLLHLQAERERPLSDKRSTLAWLAAFQLLDSVNSSMALGAITFVGGSAADAFALHSASVVFLL